MTDNARISASGSASSLTRVSSSDAASSSESSPASQQHAFADGFERRPPSLLKRVKGAVRHATFGAVIGCLSGGTPGIVADSAVGKMFPTKDPTRAPATVDALSNVQRLSDNKVLMGAGLVTRLLCCAVPGTAEMAVRGAHHGYQHPDAKVI